MLLVHINPYAESSINLEMICNLNEPNFRIGYCAALGLPSQMGLEQRHGSGKGMLERISVYYRYICIIRAKQSISVRLYLARISCSHA